MDSISRNSQHKPFLRDLLQSFLISGAIACFAYLFILAPGLVVGASMLPNFHDGQRILALRLSGLFEGTQVGEQLGLAFQRGDVVIVSLADQAEPLLKRVIGLPGEQIAVCDGQVLINNVVLDETAYLDVATRGGTFLLDCSPKFVPEGYFFVMGDNRQISKDSRSLSVGFVATNQIVGKVFLTY